MSDSSPAVPALAALLLRLDLAARLLDAAAGELRDLRLSPVQANRPSRIEQIGMALAQIFEIQHGIYDLHPELKPVHLREPSPHPEANKRLMEAMFDASELERAGDPAGAIEKYRDFLGLETTALHRAIAEGEIGRLEQQDRA